MNNFVQSILSGLFFGFIIPLLSDQLFIRKIIKQNCRYFAIHVIFNLWITYLTYNDVKYTLLYPETALDESYSSSGIITTSAISSFHTYHLIFFKNINTEELIHHIVSCFIVPFIGIILPLGNTIPICNIAMCGIPGAIDYFMLILVKYKIIHKITEKSINRWLNLLIRWPIFLLSVYILLFNLIRKNLEYGIITKLLLLLCVFLHSFNAVYYCEKVIGNYHVTLIKMKSENESK